MGLEDGNDWLQQYPDVQTLTDAEKEEVRTSLNQASGGLFLRIWQEISKLFIDYLKKSTSSPFKHVLSIFARIEYQKDRGNISHTHLMAKIVWEKLSAEEKEFLNDLIRASVIDVVRVDEVQKLIEHGIIKSIYDLDGIRTIYFQT